ncbi:hypothetical protein [Zeaxanthinibacter enoshimensis]|uniref:TfoX-like protein n=1 Tax=Zeaxanthinibacter enoshimensis TaxID=392009 RepID=A0A4R6TQ55_9FLAO|nr:hypothetical protein [Zeaxanthinibacter enoshimensis]TDQ32233.1 hypothetical protein CLV82_0056 [Zeaxanthinibacter enoshimensis]
MSKWEERLKVYDQLVASCPRFERKGKTMPYTSANGYMFSLLNHAGDIGIRYSPEVQERYIAAFRSSHFRSHNSVMDGYVLIPETMLSNREKMVKLLDESYDYVMGLEPK